MFNVEELSVLFWNRINLLKNLFLQNILTETFEFLATIYFQSNCKRLKEYKKNWLNLS